jgi:hypothetical protein
VFALYTLWKRSFKMDEWIVIVEEHTVEEAKSGFEKWKIDNPVLFRKLNKEDDILIDTIRAREKDCIIRYRIRRKL